MRKEIEADLGSKKVISFELLERFDFELERLEAFISLFLTEIESFSCSYCKGNISP